MKNSTEVNSLEEVKTMAQESLCPESYEHFCAVHDELIKRRSMPNKQINKPPEFYKSFYDENRIAMLQYASLRKNFQKMVNEVLGDNYYNMAMDTYESDRECCEDITLKAKPKCFLKSFFNR